MNKLMERSKKMRNKKGFTLIELIVVIVIIGILAAILIPRFTGVRENANEGAVIAVLRNIQNAAEMAATEANADIGDVQTASIAAILGLDAFGDLDDSPTGAKYDFSSGAAILSTEPDVYPTDGVDSYEDL